MASRAALILAAAAKRSDAHIESLPATRTAKFIQNCRNVTTICMAMLSLRPPREPTSQAVAEEGGLQFPTFPKKQTIDNVYSSLLNIWREAYNELLHPGTLKSKLDPGDVSFVSSELAALDEGTRYRIQMLVVLLREMTNRNNDMAKLIREQIPLDEKGRPLQLPGPTLAADLRSELASWIGRLDNGTSELDFDEIGARVSRRSRPGNVIFSARLIDALRVIAKFD